MPQRDCVVDTNGVVYAIDLSASSLAQYPSADSPVNPIELPVYGLLEGLVELFEIATGTTFPDSPLRNAAPGPSVLPSSPSAMTGNPFSTIVDEIREDVVADRQRKQFTNDNVAAQEAAISAAWRQTEKNMSVVSKEVAEICRELGIKPQRTTSTFRGWVFRIAGNTISIGRLGGWKRVSEKHKTVISTLNWSSSKPLSIDDLRSILKPQIAERAKGNNYRFQAWDDGSAY